MAPIRYIIIALVGSALLIAALALIIGHRTGEVDLFGTSAEVYEENLPGPVTELINEEPMTTPSNPRAVMSTTYGDITLELYEDLMPVTVANFVKLAESDFYDSTKFHRVIEGFMIQGGDPNSKGDNTNSYGTGGPGYTIQDEFVADAKLSNVRGTIAMANTGQPNSGGSQFFINLVDNTALDFDKAPFSSRHPVFGKVIAGMDVVDQIGSTETGARDLPTEAVVIKDIRIER